MKVLWLSRHDVSQDQADDLADLTGRVVVFEQRNVTFPKDGIVAAHEILDLVDSMEGVDAIAGVFPAHVAVALYKELVRENNDMDVYVPVSIPAHAKDGEIRGGGFVHSHWENLTW